LQDEFYDGDEEEGQGENEQDVHEDEPEEEESEEDDDVDVSSEDGDENDEDRVEVEDGRSFNRYSNVRLFMEGMTGDKDKLKYLDQVKQVTKFCRQASWELESRVTGKKSKASAMLDDRNDRGAIVQIKGECRPDQGPLTSQQLLKELSKPVSQSYFNTKAPKRLISYAAFQSQLGPRCSS
jgi:hypothetical protein